MTIHSLLYLAQLEEYDTNRITNWIKNNKNRTLAEQKGRLVWTLKTKLLFILVNFFSLFTNAERSIVISLNLLKPLDSLLKSFIITVAKIKFTLLNSNTTVIAITGSWGKTTTKDGLSFLLSQQLTSIASTPANHNTLLAICRQILFLPPNIKYFICEIGAYYPGDIKTVASILRPQISIVTAVGPIHLERFGSIEKIFATKMELPQSVRADGLIIMPSILKKQTSSLKFPSPNIVYFDSQDDIYLTVGKHLHLNTDSIRHSIPSIPVSDHRQSPINNGSVTIIDDTYNSNPAGFRLALNKLKATGCRNLILVTPGMIELGDLQFSENHKLATLASQICHHIIVVGQTNRSSFQNIKSQATFHFVDHLAQAQQLLPSLTSASTAVLFENDLPDHYF